MPRFVKALLVPLLLLVGWAGFMVLAGRRFPPEQTPEGAYARIVLAVTEGRPVDMFAYLETQAQWACFTIHDYRSRSLARVTDSYPESEKAAVLASLRPESDTKDGPDLWALVAVRRGFLGRLRRDLSGVKRVEVSGERATVETARGTRYGFRRRENGIWGLTLFTAELLADAEKAARDHDVLSRAADDYARAAAVGARDRR